MLKALLEERFELKYHQETKELWRRVARNLRRVRVNSRVRR